MDLGEGPGGARPPPPLFLDWTEAQRVEKSLGDSPPPPIAGCGRPGSLPISRSQGLEQRWDQYLVHKHSTWIRYDIAGEPHAHWTYSLRDGNFQRTKNSDPLHADKKCRLGNDTLMHHRLRWIHDVQLLRLFTFRTSSSRYKWSMPMLRHRILIIPGNPQKTYSLPCLIPKLSLLEPFNVKSLTWK